MAVAAVHDVIGIACCIAVAVVCSFRSIVDLLVSLWFILFPSCSTNQAVLYLNCEKKHKTTECYSILARGKNLNFQLMCAYKENYIQYIKFVLVFVHTFYFYSSSNISK